MIVDELVFQALQSDHSPRFDSLALFAFNFSYAGLWSGARADQRYPALWARNYVRKRLNSELNWDTTKISAADIEKFLRISPQFKAQTYTKVATNLNYLYEVGGLERLAKPRIERWWVDAVFLALDRLAADREIDRINTRPNDAASLLLHSSFSEISGPLTPEKSFAMGHLLNLHAICGGKDRFCRQAVVEQMAVLLPDYCWLQPNDDRPQGAVHPTNPRILKLIPRLCGPLAEAAGFQIVYEGDLEHFDPIEYIRDRATAAVESLREDGIKPTMTAEQLHKLTRGE